MFELGTYLGVTHILLIWKVESMHEISNSWSNRRKMREFVIESGMDG